MSDQTSWNPADQSAPGAPLGPSPAGQPTWSAPTANDAGAGYGVPAGFATGSTDPYAVPPAPPAFGSPQSAAGWGQPTPAPYGQLPAAPPYASPPTGAVYGGGAAPTYPPGQAGAYPAPPYGQTPYGQTPYPPYAAHQPVRSGTDGFAIAALIFGILGGWLAFVFGIIALSRIKRSGAGGRGLAIAGMVIAGVWILGFIGMRAAGAF